MLPNTSTQHHHAPAASSPLSNPSSSPSLFASARRESPPAPTSIMGQAESTVRQPDLGVQRPPPPSPQPTSKFRLAWPGRRKKSEDFTKLMNTRPSSPSLSPPTEPPPPPSSFNNNTIGRSRGVARQESNFSSVDGSSNIVQMHELSRPPSRSSSAKQLTLQFASNTLSALKGKLNTSQASIHSLKNGGSVVTSPTPTPPPLPPKPDLSRLSQSSSRSSQSSPGDGAALDRSSKPLPQLTPPQDAPAPVTEVEAQNRHQEMVTTATAPSPGSPSTSEHVGNATISSQVHDINIPQRRERERQKGAEAQTAKEIADDWRKSDSTLRTVRLVGSRTPRPLSLAESTNSGHTVLPSVGGTGSSAGNLNMGAGKRWSALMADVDFGLKEVDSEEDEEDADNDEQSGLSLSSQSAYNSVHSFHQCQEESPSSSRSASPSATASSKPQPMPRCGALSIRIGHLSGSRARATEHGQLDGSDSEALSSSVSTRGTGTSETGMFTANSSTTSVSSSIPGASTKEGRPSIEIASSASIASSFGSEQRPQYKANAKLEPWISLPATNQTASESQASLSTSESASASASVSVSSHIGSPDRHTDTENSGKNAGSMSPPRGTTLRPVHQRTRLQSIQARGFRQTAVSLTTGFAPAAGFARKAVDRLGRALGGSSTSIANTADSGALAVSDGGSHGLGHASSALFSGAGAPPTFGAGLGGVGQNAYQQEQLHDRQRHTHAHTPHPPSSAKKHMRRRHGANPSGTWSVNSNSTSDTDGGAAGPNLGRCLRGPLMPYNGMGSSSSGLVFGRDLASCARDTACAGAVENGEGGGLFLEGRHLPALVVRCAQHIVKWGVQEEGLFRISGRATHISKLRAEFDSGADYDLRECGPGEIDPHAVASIFKAYLRELPEPLLTRQLVPYFDAALSAEQDLIKAANDQYRGEGKQNDGERTKRMTGLPSNPRDSAQVRKAPSLSTFAVPALSPRIASQTLLNALSALIERLPKENKDLLRTVTELIMATARASRETKMPLSNLLLVFCPSLVMSPPLLRVLCEGEGIWDGPIVAEDMNPSVPGEVPIEGANADKEVQENESIDEEKRRGSEESETGLRHQGTIRRAPRGSSEDFDFKAKNDEQGDKKSVPPTSLPSLVLLSSNGEPSATSAHTKTNSSISISMTTNLSSPDDLTHSSNSSDSLHTPASSSPGSVSPSPNASLVPSGTVVTKPVLDTTGLTNKIMALRAQSDLPSPLSPSAAKKAVRKSLIGSPVPFPPGGMSNNGSSVPVTPIELSGLDKLGLTTSHQSSSSPNLGREAAGAEGGARSACSTPSRLGRQKSKASMLGLKTKRSLSSLLGMAQAQEHAGIRPSPDLTRKEQEHRQENVQPEPEVQAPRSSTPCPVLNLPMDASQIALQDGLGLGLSLSLTEEARSDKAQSGKTPDIPKVLRVPSSMPSRSPSPSPPLDLHLHPQQQKQQQQQGTPPMLDRAESSSSAVTNSVFYTPPTTARALAPATWSNSVSSSTSTTSTNMSSGSYSFLDFNLGKSGEEEEDWAKSVLRAAASSS